MNIMKATNDEKQKLIAKSDSLQNQLVEQITPLTADHKKLITQHREGLLSQTIIVLCSSPKWPINSML